MGTDIEEIEEEEPSRGRGKAPRKTPSLDIDMAEFNRLAEERVRQYESDFDADSVTTADQQQLRTLAELSVLSELANRKAAMMVLGEFSPQDQKYVSDSAAKYSMEARQLATSLGIDRKSRVTGQESELETYLPTLHKEAKKFLYERAVAIVCPHCLASEAKVELRMGTIIYHFAYELEWAWTSICPKCKGKIRIDQNNYTKFLFSELDKGPQKSDSKDELVDDAPGEDEE